MNEAVIDISLQLAFEAGKWAGQVELEEHYDREQYSTVCLESVFARKSAMSLEKPSIGKTVKINLRSDEWREGVKKSSLEYVEKAKKFLIENI